MGTAEQSIGALGRPIILPAGWFYTDDGTGCTAITDGNWLITRACDPSTPIRDDEPVLLGTGETWDRDPQQFPSVGAAIRFADRYWK